MKSGIVKYGVRFEILSFGDCVFGSLVVIMIDLQVRLRRFADFVKLVFATATLYNFIFRRVFGHVDSSSIGSVIFAIVLGRS